ncbi:MAG: F0F1 ATP synthase subunit C [Bacteroidetes bacterium]|nr:F0F1 ATP synthase subunit C [Bacteroidota bacterium]
MDNITLIAITSIITAGLTIGVGCMIPAVGQGKAITSAMNAIAQQPDAEQTITRSLFIGLAMLESLAIYCFVIAMILIFANPFWNHFISQ